MDDIYEVQRKNGNDIRDFDAISDGKTDSTAAIQSAINYLSNGGVLIIPKGCTFIISASLNIFSQGITITGGGKIIKKSGANCPTFNVTANYTVIDGIQIDGNRTNQTIFNYSNDEIFLNQVQYCRIENNIISNSAGGGIHGEQSGYNIIKNNIIQNVHDNGIMMGDKGSDYNIIEGNYVSGTTAQNGIFITASAGSTSTTDSIYGNIIKNNRVFNAGDTSIEAGIHSVSTIMEGNQVYNCTNAGLLFRDTTYSICKGNYVEQTNAPGSNADGIAFMQQLADVPDKHALIEGNIIVNAKRNGIYTQDGNRIKIIGNEIKNASSRGIYLSGDYMEVQNNKIKDCANGSITIDEFGSSVCNYSVIEGNTIDGGGNGIIAYQKSLNYMNIRNNILTGYSGTGLKFDNSTAVNSFCYGNTKGVTTTNINIFSKQLNGLSGATVPLSQYDQLQLSIAGDIGLIMVRFGSEYALFYTLGNGSLVWVANSTNIAQNLTGFAGWGIGADGGNNIILQRRGPTVTGNLPYVVSFLNT